MKWEVFFLHFTTTVAVFSRENPDCKDGKCESVSRTKREVTVKPELEIYASYEEIPMPIYPGETLKVYFSVNHTSTSGNDAHCVHIRFSIPRFLEFKAITNNFGILPTVQEEKDDLSFKYPYVLWHYKSVAVTFELYFDPNKVRKPGRHYLTIPLWMHYYDEWEETPEGVTIKKGNKIIVPMQTISETFQNGVFTLLLQRRTTVRNVNCYLPLGINSGDIKAYMITASSNYPDSQPSQCRMDEDGWCAEIVDDEQYLQVDFEYLTLVSKVEIKARKTKVFWVESYFLQFSEDGEEWLDYFEHGERKIFSGNVNKEESASQWLINGIEAYSIRLRPVTWREMICLRLELYGCKVEGSPKHHYPENPRTNRWRLPIRYCHFHLEGCLSALGMESGYIPDAALKSKAGNATAPGNPSQGRLNKVVQQYPFGWMALQGFVDYFQIDFGGVRKVTRVVTQGGWTSEAFSQYFVKSFLIEYSNNSYDLTYYREKGRLKMVPGPKNGYEAKHQVTYKLKTPIVARFLRFIPMAANFAKVMRVEVVGCLLEDMPAYQESADFSRRSVLSTPDGIFFVCMYTSSQQESSCFHTSDGSTWNSMKQFIVNVLGYDASNGTIYALDRNYNYRMTTDGGETWISVLRSQWENSKRAGKVVTANDIPENLVTDTPSDNMTFSTPGGIKWGVSGSGIHMMTDVGTWNMIGQWKCCGL